MRCPLCRRSGAEFYPSVKTRCKHCCNRTQQHWESKNRERVQAIYALSTLRTNARRRGLVVSLTIDQVFTLLQRKQCECCNRRTRKKRLTLDRVFSSRGYHFKNMAVLCATCNRRKQDSTIAQLQQIAAWLQKRCE